MSTRSLRCVLGALALAGCSELTRPVAVDGETTKVEAALFPAPLPDLIVSSLAHIPTNPTTRDVITFTAIVRNIGTASAGASQLEFRIGGETPGAPQTRFAVPVLIPGQTFTVKRQMMLIAQNYRNTATADVNNNVREWAQLVSERGERNNVKTDDYTVTWPPSLIAFVSQRQPVCCANGNPNIYTMSPNGTGVTQLTNTIYAIDPAWKPDGSTIAFSTYYSAWSLNEWRINVMNADGGGVTELTSSANDFSPVWSPNGQKIAFQRGYGVSSDPGEIYLLALSAAGNAASGIINLTNHPANDLDPAWKPDGSQIAFSSDRSGSADIYLMNTDGTGVAPLINTPTWHEYSPAWKPDGSWIAFTRSARNANGDLISDIYVMHASGTGETQLTYTGDAHSPAWSPTGSQIAFVRNGEIYLMNPADGTGIVNLTNHPASDSRPSWGWAPLP